MQQAPRAAPDELEPRWVDAVVWWLIGAATVLVSWGTWHYVRDRLPF